MRSLLNRFKRLCRLVINILRLHNWYWARQLAGLAISPNDVRMVYPNHALFLRRLNLALLPGQHSFLLHHYRWALELLTKSHGRFVIDDNNRLVATVGAIRTYVETAEELYILNEIFVRGIYNFTPAGPIVVWDIGMNVAMAALYFAGVKEVPVVGYEPFSDTYTQALQNIKLNPDLMPRLNAINAGIGSSVGVSEAFYCRELRGSSGTQVAPKQTRNGHRMYKTSIRLESAKDALDGIRKTFPNHKVMAKIDCEGSEFDIFRSLANADALSGLHAVMMEWHRLDGQNDPEELVDLLQAAYFTVFLLDPVSDSTGMLYAVRDGMNDIIATGSHTVGSNSAID